MYDTQFMWYIKCPDTFTAYVDSVRDCYALS